MRGVNVVRTVLFIANFHLLSTQNEPGPSDVVDHIGQREHYTFVAILDILFRDNVKRQCSGAIIHDYVVLTAAHCFISPDTFPELTLTFVVVGTKKMYNTGYEQYLPVERYKIHPRYKGWTADLALVYTYMSMTAGKPGKTIMLAGEKLKNPIDTSVLVLSWGHSATKIITKKEEQQNECKPVKGEKATRSCTGQPEMKATLGVQELNNEGIPTLVSGGYQQPNQPAAVEGYRQDGHYRPRSENNPDLSYLNDRLENIQSRLLSKNSTTEKYLLSLLRQSINRGIRRQGVQKPDDNVTLDALASTSTTERNSSIPLQGTRRKIEHLSLTVEMFSFRNLQICKQIVEKALPPIYTITDGGDIICYSSEDSYISNEDSGAPLVRHGLLLGITVGGVEVDNEHVAVAMRMPCFCGWIAANLPYGGNTMDCCSNCCTLAITTPKPNSGKKILAFDRA